MTKAASSQSRVTLDKPVAAEDGEKMKKARDAWLYQLASAIARPASKR